MSYFKTNYFNPTVSLANFLIFENVHLYKDYNSSSSFNYENLFATYEPSKNPTTDPPSNSLFYLDNIKNLVKVGKNTPNIITHTEWIYNVTFIL